MEHVADEVEQRDVAQPQPSVRRPGRRKLGWSFVLAGLAIVGAIIYLVVANTGSTAEYYMNINELRACTTCTNQTVRVAGIVAPNSVTRNDATQTIHFTIAQGSLLLPVVYNGIVPDTFRAGVQVVAEGHLVNGVFQAQNVLAKCPSKFQSATPGATGSSAG
ncbi:MAG: cytochrome c maturation protein CcmE [Ktedonobacterales bacterium]